MKRLILLVIGLLCGSVVGANDYCRDISNQWTLTNAFICAPTGENPPTLCDGLGVSTWTLVQNASGGINGTVGNLYCGGDGVYYNVTITPGTAYSHNLGPGTYNGIAGNGFFIYGGSGYGDCSPLSMTFVIPYQHLGCNAATVAYWSATSDVVTTGYVAGAPLAVPNRSNYPDAETSYFQYWQPGGLMVTQTFLRGPWLQADLNGNGAGEDINYDWSGRSLRESFSNETGDPLTCYEVTSFGDPGPDWVMSSAGMGSPGGHKNWYVDGNGYNVPPFSRLIMGEVRSKSLFPCGVTGNQIMAIDCPAGVNGCMNGWWAYNTHLLVNQIPNQTLVHVIRNTVDQTNPYGYSGQMYAVVVVEEPNYWYFYYHRH